MAAVVVMHILLRQANIILELCFHYLSGVNQDAGMAMVIVGFEGFIGYFGLMRDQYLPILSNTKNAKLNFFGISFRQDILPNFQTEDRTFLKTTMIKLKQLFYQPPAFFRVLSRDKARINRHSPIILYQINTMLRANPNHLPL